MLMNKSTLLGIASAYVLGFAVLVFAQVPGAGDRYRYQTLPDGSRKLMSIDGIPVRHPGEPIPGTDIIPERGDLPPEANIPQGGGCTGDVPRGFGGCTGGVPQEFGGCTGGVSRAGYGGMQTYPLPARGYYTQPPRVIRQRTMIRD